MHLFPSKMSWPGFEELQANSLTVIRCNQCINSCHCGRLHPSLCAFFQLFLHEPTMSDDEKWLIDEDDIGLSRTKDEGTDNFESDKEFEDDDDTRGIKKICGIFH